ncbi:uncharacterized protein LOC143185254 [Calliopsis andreniformis]|uniref:uncharacterized protein LOC143185254 n=1 Tax=Calliopsis andreniformis TaxID=337506 RepID=UPI003FCDD212
MDNNTTSLNSQNASQSVAQRKFYQWVLKWINGFSTCVESGNEGSRDIQNSTKPDVATLASLLQAIGFKLVSFEKHNDAHVEKKVENDTSTLKVTIECGTSDMKAILELGDITCRCPNSDHIKDASFWSISGTGPTASTDNIVQKVEETGSNLLPRLSKDVTKVLHDVSYRLFEIIVCEPDLNRNTNISLNASRLSNASCARKAKEEISKTELGVIRSYTQPEIRTKALRNSKEEKENNSQISADQSTTPKKPMLERQKTWDINIETESLDGEPRPSPPKITSSPSMIAELSNSFGQISLQGEIENHENLTEYIIGAQQNLEKALKMLSLKKPTILIDLAQDDGASVKSAPANMSPSTVSPTYSSTIGNAKIVSKSTHVTQKQQALKLNSGSVTPLSKARRSIDISLPKSIVPKNTQIDQNSSKFRRRSFYLPSSANSKLSLLSKPSDVGQKLLGNGKFSSTTKTSVSTESDLRNRTYAPTRKLISPELRNNASPNSEMVSAAKTRTPSMIKPPTIISKPMSARIKSVQSPKKSTGIAKKSRMSVSKE